MTTELMNQEVPMPDVIDRLAARVPSYEPRNPTLLETTRAIKAIDGPDTRTLVLEYAGQVQSEIKACTAHFTPYNKAANDLRNKLAALRDGTLAVWDQELTRIKGIVMAWDREQERLRREAEEKARMEAERKAREERQRIAREAQEERDRLEREAQEEAARLEAEGKAQEAEDALNRATVESQMVADQAEEMVAEIIPEMIIIPPAVPMTAVKGASKRRTFKPVYKDLDELIVAAAANPFLRGYLIWHETAIGAAVRAQGEAFRCPGVEVVEETGMTIRGK